MHWSYDAINTRFDRHGFEGFFLGFGGDNLICSNNYSSQDSVPSYPVALDIICYRNVDEYNLEDTVSIKDSLSIDSETDSISTQVSFPPRLDMRVNVDSRSYWFTDIQDGSVNKYKGFIITPYKEGNFLGVGISPDTSKKDLWLDKSTYFVSATISDTDTVDISDSVGTANFDTIYFDSYKDNISAWIDTPNLILSRAVSSNQFDYYLPDSTIKGENVVFNKGGTFGIYGDSVFYGNYYDKSAEDNLKMHLHFNMRKKTSDYTIHENEIWKSPENTITSLNVKKFYGIPDTSISGILPGTDYKLIKYEGHNQNNRNKNSRQSGGGSTVTYKLYLKSGEQLIYLGNQNIDSIELYSNEDWIYSNDIEINPENAGGIDSILQLLPYGSANDFNCSVSAEIMRNSTVLTKDSSIILDVESDTIVPLLGMNFIMKPSGNGIELNFNPDTGYYRTFFTDSISNPYLKFTKWQPIITYPNGKRDDDIFLDSIFGEIHTDTIEGHGGDCYFQPEIYWTGNTPKDYIIVKTKTPVETPYSLFYIQDSIIRPVDGILHQPMNENDSVLGYWNVADVYGKVRLLVFQYNGMGQQARNDPGDATDSNPDSIKYRDFIIGDVVTAGSYGVGARGSDETVVSSPYGRAVLYFPADAFSTDTIAKITPVGFDEDNIGEASPYLGGNMGPVVKMYPMGKEFNLDNCPRLEYNFTNREKNDYNIDVNNISLFSISNNGEIRRINASIMIPAFANEDTIWTITARPEEFPKDGEHRYFTVLKDNETAELGVKIKKTKVFPDGRVGILLATTPTDSGVICPDSLFLTDVWSSSDSQDSLNMLKGMNIYDVKGKTVSPNIFPISNKIINLEAFRKRNEDTMITVILNPGVHKIFLTASIDSGRGENIIRNSEVITTLIDNSGGVLLNKDTLDITRTKPDTVILTGGNNYSVDYTLRDENNNELINRRYDPDNSGITRITWNGYIDFLPVKNGQYYGTVMVSDSSGNVMFNKTVVWNVDLNYNISILSPHNGDNLRGDVPLYTDMSGRNVKWYIKSSGNWIYIGSDNGEGFVLQSALFGDGGNIGILAKVEDQFGNVGIDSVTVNLDNTPPQIDIEKSGTGENDYYSKLLFGFNVRDTVSGISFSRMYIEEDNINGYESHATFNGTSLTINSDTLDEGNFDINIVTKDNAGNTKDYTYRFTIDRTPPQIAIGGEPTYFIKNGVLCLRSGGKITIGVQDQAETEIEYALNNYGPHIPGQNRWHTYTGPIDCSDIVDSAVIHYRATDIAGNASVEKANKIYINKTLPNTHFSYSLHYVSGDTIFVSPDAFVNLYADTTFVGTKAIYYNTAGQVSGYVKYTEPFQIYSEGMHSISAYAVNNLDERGETNEKRIFTDGTPPSISLNITGKRSVRAGGVTVDTASTIAIECSDTGSGLKYVNYEINGVMHEYTVPFNINTEGHYELVVYASDNVNNDVSRSFDINVVSGQPHAAFFTVGPEHNGFICDSTLIGIVVSDSGFGADSVLYKIDSGNYEPYDEPFSLKSYGEGPHYVCMRIVDSTGGVFEDFSLYTLDETSPEIAFSINGTHVHMDSLDYIISSSFLTFHFSDSLSGVSINGYRINNLDWSNITDSFEIGLSSFPDGYYRIELRSKDNVDNITYDTIYACKDDSAPNDSIIPVGRYITRGDTLFVSPNGGIDISTHDSYVGTDSILYAFNDNEFIPYAGEISLNGLNAGANKLKIKVNDRLGNVRIDTTILNIDADPPTISDTLFGDYTVVDSTLFVKDSTRLRLVFNDTSSGIYENRCKINDFYTLYLPDTFEMDFSSFVDGFINLFIESEDNVGNIDTLNCDFCVDNTPPVINVDYSNAFYGDSVYVSPFSYIKINCSDNYSEIDSIHYKIDDDNYAVYTDSISCNALSEGKHGIIVTACDGAGNADTVADSFYLDKTAPTVSIDLFGPRFFENDTTFISSDSRIMLNAADSISGTDSLYYSFGGMFTPFTGDSIIVTGNDSLYYLYYYVKDRVGNTSDTSMTRLYLDNTPPKIKRYYPYDNMVLNTNHHIDEITGEETYEFYFRYGVSDRDSIKSVIYFYTSPYDSFVCDTFYLSDNDSVKYDYSYTVELPPRAWGEIYGPYMFAINVSDKLGNIRVDTVLGFEWGDSYDMIAGQYNGGADFTVRGNRLYVSNPVSPPAKTIGKKSPRDKELRYDVLPSGIYKYDLDGNMIDSLLENDFLGGIQVDDNENVYSLYLNDEFKRGSEDTVALKINFATGDKEAISDSIGTDYPCGIKLDSAGNIYIGMRNETDSLRIDVFDKLLYRKSVNLFSSREGAFTVDDSGRIYVVNIDSSIESECIYRYIPDGNNYVKDTAFALILPYGIGSIGSINRDSLGIFYISAYDFQTEKSFLLIEYPMYDFNNEWISYAGYLYNPDGYLSAYDFRRHGNKLYYINNNLYECDVSIPMGRKNAKKLSGSIGGEPFEITLLVPYPSPFDPLKEVANIRITISDDAIGDLYILDLAGNPVKTMRNINFRKGINEVQWNGRNESGRMCNNGVYSLVVKAKSGEKQAERYTKIMLIKGGN